MTLRGWLVLVAVICGLLPTEADAQSLGTFRWQLQPYCNVVVVTVVQQGAHYRIDGTDDQCGAARGAAVGGLAFVNPDGSIGFGLHIVTTPGGVPIDIDATISILTLSGTWRDSAGASGAFTFTSGPASGGTPRPISTTSAGDITAVAAGNGLTGGGVAGDLSMAVDFGVAQRRVATTCPAGQLMVSVNQDGTVSCQAVTGGAGGDITGVTAGAGLTGGGGTGDVALAVNFGGPGTALAAARSDHQHQVGPSGTAIGAGALGTQTTGIDNAAVGFQALTAVTTGSRNTALGSAALRAEVTGVANTAVGHQALRSHTTGNGNVAVGDSALATNTAGNFAVAIGYGALAGNTTGTGNTAVGFSALNLNSTGSNNTAMGSGALAVNTTAADNAAVGAQALAAATTGGRNTAVGSSALRAETTGVANTAIGNGALQNHSTGNGNVALGDSALASVTSGNYAVAVGYGALASNTTGTNNTAVGTGALNLNNTGVENTATGFGALGFNSTGNHNTATGFYALAVNTEGSNNTVMGHGALLNNFGHNNVAVGTSAGSNLFGGSYNIYIGSGVLAGTDNEFNTIRIGYASGGRAFMSNIRNTITDYNDAVPVVIDHLGQLGTVSSSRRTKEHITNLGDVSRAILKLRPVQFTYKTPFADGSTPLQYGMIAEEVEEVLPALVAYGADGQPETVKYHILPTLLLAEVQRLEHERVALSQRLADQAGAIAELRALVEELRARKP